MSEISCVQSVWVVGGLKQHEQRLHRPDHGRQPHNRPVPGTGRRPANPSPPAPITTPDMGRLLEIINKHRYTHGQAMLVPDSQLGIAASEHSADMAAHQKLMHDGSDGSAFITRFEKVGYHHLYAGEIIAWDPRLSEEGVVQLWMNSPPHYAIMFSDAYTEFGAGYSDGYWTVDFGTRRAW